MFFSLYLFDTLPVEELFDRINVYVESIFIDITFYDSIEFHSLITIIPH